MGNNEDARILSLMQATVSQQRKTLQEWGYGDTGLLMLMSACDGNCFFCAQPSVTNPAKEDITSKKAIERWLDAPPPSNILIGGTEPLSHPLLYSALQFLQQFQCSIELMTSGIRLQDAITVEKLRNLGLRRVCIPIYAAEANLHDSIVGVEGHWKKVCNAIRLCTEQNITVLLHTLVLRKNLFAVSRLAHWVAEQNLAPLVVAPVREKESVFSYTEEGVSFDAIAKELQDSRVQCTGFPLCFAPNIPRGGPTIIQLYFKGQEKTFCPTVCAHCSQQSSCEGVTMKHLHTFLSRDIHPFS